MSKAAIEPVPVPESDWQLAGYSVRKGMKSTDLDGILQKNRQGNL